MGKDHSESVGNCSPNVRRGGARDGTFTDPRVRPGSWPGKVRRRLGKGEAGRPALPLGSPCLPAETSSSLREVRGAAPEGSGGARAAALTPAWGAEGLPQGALTVMAAPRDGGSRRQEGVKGSRAGLSGAGIPLPPPLSAARRRSSGPTLPRRCSGPFHPPIKLFFFFSNFLGGPGRANGRWGSRDKQWLGLQTDQWERGPNPGAGPAATGRAREGGRMGAGRREGGPRSGRECAGRKEQSGMQVISFGYGAGVPGVVPTSPGYGSPLQPRAARRPSLMGRGQSTHY